MAWTGPSGDSHQRSGEHHECSDADRSGLRVCGAGHARGADRGDHALAAHTTPASDPLGALADLLGTWKGHGFNAIWRPHHPAAQQDRFLELNMTDETLVFTRINGAIPNRGLAMADINMFGHHLHAADQRVEHRGGAAHRAGHLGLGAPHDRSQRAGHRGADGLDPARHHHPRPGRRPGSLRRSAEHPGQQHPAVLLRQPGARQRRLQLGVPDVHRAQPVSGHPVPLQGARRDPGHRQEPQQRAADRAARPHCRAPT